jgi:hypothetical protein
LDGYDFFSCNTQEKKIKMISEGDVLSEKGQDEKVL